MRARMRQTGLRVMVAVTSIIVHAGTALAQPGSPTNIGTWTLNPGKSVFSAGTAPRSATIIVEAAGAGVKVTVDDLHGNVRHWYYTANYDGKDSAIVGDSSFNDVTVALTRVDAHTTTGVFKQRGTPKYTETSVVSNDGRTMTITTAVWSAVETTNNRAGMNRQSASVGQGPTKVAFYDKQQAPLPWE